MNTLATQGINCVFTTRIVCIMQKVNNYHNLFHKLPTDKAKWIKRGNT